ncbi:MAG TPA: amidohydrolase family protein [Chthoniobacterales bacterium]|nr:amidohydrolase family protein [Chthoniobacterales bacterium]
MIIRARIVVTMDGPPIDNGAVAVSGDRITDVANFPEISARHAGEEIVDLGEQALLPGLINAHCHLDYTCLRGKIPRQQSFTDWIRAINAEKAKLSPEDYVRSINEGFAEAKRFGTTTIANLTAFPELVAQIHAPIRTWWFAELIDVRDPSRANEIVDAAVGQLKSAEHWGLAPHAPFTASVNLYRRCEEIARRENVSLTTHLAESREEMSMFRDGSGPLHEFLKEIGRDMNDCGEQTPLARLSEIVRDSSAPVGMTERWMLVHLNELTKNEFDLLAKSERKFSVIHCPRSHAYFGHSPFEYDKLGELGFNICLGTDSLASNTDLSLFAEMREFRKTYPNVSPEEVFKTVTVNSAHALRQDDALGKIRSGCLADLIAVPCARSTSVFEEIPAFDRSVSWLMISGQVSA